MYFINLGENQVQQQIKALCKGKSGVYQITNRVNEKRYIGSAITKTGESNRLYYRFRNHFFNHHKEFPIKRAIKRYGVQQFSFKILEFTNILETRSRESWYIKEYLPEYNVLQIADSSLGYRHTSAIKEKIRANYRLSRRQAIGLLYKGKKRSPGEREKLRAIALARTPLQKERHKEICTIWNRECFSKPTQILHGNNLSILGNYSSLKEACTTWKGNYRAFKEAVKSGKKINKYNIYVKYCS